MFHGKRTCKILKEIRQQIADKNEIAYVASECHFHGECQGTCPKCDEELQYIENELNKRRQLGKAVAVAWIALGVVGTFPNCKTPQQISVPTIDATKEKPVASAFVYTQAQGIAMIKEKVVDDGEKTPLEFATVRLVQERNFVKGMNTDRQGLFTRDSVPTGKYDIIIAYPGLSDHRIKDIEIKENNIIDIGVIQSESSTMMGLVIKKRVEKE